MRLKPDDSQDGRCLCPGYGRRGHRRRELTLRGRDPRKLDLEDPGHVRDRMMNEYVQPRRVDCRVHDESLACQPRYHAVIVCLEGQVRPLHFLRGNLVTGVEARVKLDGVSHLQADDHVDRCLRLARGQRVADDSLRNRGTCPVDASDGLGKYDALAQILTV
jgi:hypothetical protein